MEQNEGVFTCPHQFTPVLAIDAHRKMLSNFGTKLHFVKMQLIYTFSCILCIKNKAFTNSKLFCKVSGFFRPSYLVEFGFLRLCTRNFSFAFHNVACRNVKWVFEWVLPLFVKSICLLLRVWFSRVYRMH